MGVIGSINSFFGITYVNSNSTYMYKIDTINGVQMPFIMYGKAFFSHFGRRRSCGSVFLKFLLWHFFCLLNLERCSEYTVYIIQPTRFFCFVFLDSCLFCAFFNISVGAFFLHLCHFFRLTVQKKRVGCSN